MGRGVGGREGGGWEGWDGREGWEGGKVGGRDGAKDYDLPPHMNRSPQLTSNAVQMAYVLS